MRFITCCADCGVSVEAIGCANAPRTVYEATFEGHRALPVSSGLRNGAASARIRQKAMYCSTSTVRLFRNGDFARLERN